MINLGLSRISSLLRPLFNTHDPLPWRAIHIAGTNGKGSVASYISTFLSYQGYKVGRFTSPHLINRWDCIWLNSRVVEKDVFLEVESELKDRSAKEGINASEFEILTAVAFELFTRHGMDFGVVECGLGGRLDATNALRSQDVAVSVLAKVGLDHTEFLGSTLKEIAGEKCGIFKKDVPVVVDESNEDVIKDVVKEKLQEVNTGAAEGLWFRLPTDQTAVLNADAIRGIGLADHQKQNLSTAYTAYYAAEQRQSSSKATSSQATTTQSFEQRIESTIQHLPTLIKNSHASIRGRLEWLPLPPHLQPAGNHDPSVRALIDGAHNPQSADALASYINGNIRTNPSGPPITWVISMKRGKEIETILRTLVHEGDNAVTCSFGPVDGMPWVESLDAEQLAKQVQELTSGKVEAAPHNGDIASAIQLAVTMADGGPLCIAGSLYLVGDVLRLVVEADR
jgi:folylpolyglutamate synthase/dihydrofolate synthase